MRANLQAVAAALWNSRSVSRASFAQQSRALCTELLNLAARANSQKSKTACAAVSLDSRSLSGRVYISISALYTHKVIEVVAETCAVIRAFAMIGIMRGRCRVHNAAFVKRNLSDSTTTPPRAREEWRVGGRRHNEMRSLLHISRNGLGAVECEK